MIILFVALCIFAAGSIVIGFTPLANKVWLRRIWAVLVAVLCFAAFNVLLVKTNEPGLPISSNDIGCGSYQLQSCSMGDTVNALIYGENSNACVTTTRGKRVWAIAIPLSLWHVRNDYTGAVYVSRVTINNESKVVVTSSPPKFP